MFNLSYNVSFHSKKCSYLIFTSIKDGKTICFGSNESLSPLSFILNTISGGKMTAKTAECPLIYATLKLQISITMFWGKKGGMIEGDKTETCRFNQSSKICHQCPLHSLQQVDGMPGFRYCKRDTDYIILSDTEKKVWASSGFSICQHRFWVNNHFGQIYRHWYFCFDAPVVQGGTWITLHLCPKYSSPVRS